MEEIDEQLDRIEFMLKTDGIVIGKYQIYWDSVGLAIYHADGEGGNFNEKEFEEIIDKFYTKNF